MSKTLPELPYFTLGELAKAWGCGEGDILHRGIAGQVKICALSAGWELQEGYRHAADAHRLARTLQTVLKFQKDVKPMKPLKPLL